MDDDPIEKLLADLEHSLRIYSRKYLEMREVVLRTDKSGNPTAYLAIEDAKANTILFMEANHIATPEVCRYRLHAALAIERAVEPS